MRVEFDKFRFEYSQSCFEYGRVISQNDLEGQQGHNVQKVQKQPFEIKRKILGHMLRWCWKGDLDNIKLVPLDI